MYKIATLILVLYVIQSIFRRSVDRKRDMERMQQRVNDLSKIVTQMKCGKSPAEVSEAMLEYQVKDILTQFEQLDVPLKREESDVFEQLHFVEETISKSAFMASDQPTIIESTLH